MLPLDQRIKQARIKLVHHQKFFSTIIFALPCYITDKISTAATDGRCIMWNEEFCSKLSDDEMLFVYAHELFHVVYKHMVRKPKSYNHQLWNAAADFIINYQISEMRLGSRPELCLYDEKFVGMNIYQIYEEMEKNAQCVYQNFDEHVEEGEFHESDQIRGAIINGCGRDTSGIVRGLVREYTKSKIDYRKLISQSIQSQIRDDYTFSKRAKRSLATPYYLPGMNNKTEVELDIAIDTSGSIDEEALRKFFSEIKAMLTQFGSLKARVWSFDTAVHNYQEYDACNLDEILSYEPQGGGGTDFDVNWAFMKKNKIVPKTFVMFTDGYCNVWGDPNYCPTLWLIYQHASCVAPHGTTVHFE